MRSLLLSCAFLPLALSAQRPPRTLHTDSGTVVLHYFANGHVSTKEWMDATGRWGHTWAYDAHGQVIVDHATRKVAGHASVWFNYHPNGAISRAEFSDAPDAGIQWYRSITTFNADCQRTGFTEEGHDDNGPIPGVPLHVAPTPVPQPVETPEPVVEQRLFTNEYFVVNAGRRPCRVSLRPKAPSPAAQPLDATLLKGDTLRGGAYTLGEMWAAPQSQVDVSATAADRKRKLIVLRVDTVCVSAEHRRYYFILGKGR